MGLLIVGILSAGLAACNGIAGDYLVGPVDASVGQAFDSMSGDGPGVADDAADANGSVDAPASPGPESSIDDAAPRSDALTSSLDASLEGDSPSGDSADALDGSPGRVDGNAVGDAIALDVQDAADAQPVVCLGNRVACDGRCADLTSDNSNCGSCGLACSAGHACYEGTCCLIGGTCSACGTEYPYFCDNSSGNCWNQRTDCSTIVECSDGGWHACSPGGGEYDCASGNCSLDAGSGSDGGDAAAAVCGQSLPIGQANFQQIVQSCVLAEKL